MMILHILKKSDESTYLKVYIMILFLNIIFLNTIIFKYLYIDTMFPNYTILWHYLFLYQLP